MGLSLNAVYATSYWGDAPHTMMLLLWRFITPPIATTSAAGAAPAHSGRALFLG